MHVRGIVITCDVLIQSEHVNTILAETLWSRRRYRGHVEAIVLQA
jgi:hypothetical protein